MNLQQLLTTNLFPEFYREEYPQIVEFVKSYYQFLETTYSGKLGGIRDIDESMDLFTDSLREEFAKEVPQFGRMSDKEFLIFAKEFYASRGSEGSYKFLFRAMFGKEIEVFHPSTVVLRASDGRWEQDVSIRIALTGGDATDVINQTITARDTSGKKVQFLVRGAKNISGNQWELLIDRFFSGNIAVDDTVEYQTFSGVVLSGASTITILSAGGNAKSGEFFEVNSGSRILRFRISKRLAGVPKKVEIIYADGLFPGVNYALVTHGTRTPDYFGPSLPAGPFGANQSLLLVESGPTLRYPGYYSSSSGFLSDINKLQDSSYYQSFSYVIKLDEQLSAYKNAVKKLLHPSGFALWADFEIKNEIKLDVDLVRSLKGIIHFLSFEDEITIQERSWLDVHKPFSDQVSTSDRMSTSIGKAFADTIGVSDSGSLNIIFSQDYVSVDYLLDPTELPYLQGSGLITRSF